MQQQAKRHLVGLGNRPVHELTGIPVNHRTSPRWQNVDHGVYRSEGPNTGYRYAGDGFTGARYPGDELASVRFGDPAYADGPDHEELQRAVRRQMGR